MELNQIKNYILKNVFTGLVKTILTLVLSIVAIPLIIKNIGIEQYGIISIVLIFSSFTGVLDLGLSKALITFQNSDSIRGKEITSIYLINIILFFTIAIMGIIVYFLNINFFGENIGVNSETLRLMNSVAILLLALGLFNNLLRASLEANFKLQLINWGFLIQSIIINLGWLLLAIRGADVKSFLFVPLISSLVTILYHLIFLIPVFPSFVKPNKNSFKNVFEITSQFFKVGALNSVHLPIIKYLIIFYLGDGRAIGIFELSTKLSVIANNLLAYISNPFFSIVSKHQAKSREYLWGIIKKVTGILILVTVIGYTVFLLIEKYLIKYFFDTYTNQIFLVLNFVLVGYLFIAASESIQKYFLGTGAISLVAKIKFIGIILNGFILFILYIASSLNLQTISFAYAFSLFFIGSFWLFNLIIKQTFLAKLRLR